ncbi:MAG: hypothetical protein HXS41_14465 [Theionarchaea archaeon]|nr:hypothetical protein [Theionarchaea archaeon]
MKRMLTIIGLLIGCMVMIEVAYASDLDPPVNEGEDSKINLTVPGDKQIVGSGTTFKWDSEDQSPYTLRISEKDDFPQGSREETITTNLFTEWDSLKLEAGKVYYWKVTCGSRISEVRSFKVGYKVDVAVLDENSEIMEGMTAKFTSLDDFSSSSEVIQEKAQIYGYGLGYITIEDADIRELVFITRDETFLLKKGTKVESLNLEIKDMKGKRGIKSVSVFLDGNFVGQTDEQGKFEISEVSEGGHRLYFAKEGYTSVQKNDVAFPRNEPYEYNLSRSNSYWLEKLLQSIPIVFCVILLIFLLRVRNQSEKANNALRALLKEQESVITESRREVRTIREYVTKILERT